MNKTEYLNRMGRLLRRLPKEERETALRYYEEFFEEAGPEHEAEVIAQLGTPEQVAAGIIGEYAVRQEDSGAKNGLHTLGMVLAALFAAPIALPVALAVLVTAAAMMVVLLAIILAFGCAGASLVLAGVFTFGSALVLLVSSPATGLFFGGIGLIAACIGGALVFATVCLCKKGFSGVAKFAGKVLVRRKSK